jgi:hypothetical protein
MGVWAVAVLDTGVTDETEAVYGASLYAYNFYAGTDDTDGGRTDSHGSRVAAAAELTNSSLERIDMQVASASGYFYSSSTASALTQLATMDTAGWSIGSYNMSFGSLSSTFSSTYQSQITELASRGIFGVAASGNYGSHGSLEDAAYPARLTNVISVGSHDGNGNPTDFSNNNASTVHVLADGEDFPASGNNGTSYASPQVAATVATVQALVKSTTDDRLTFNETVDVLQQGGAGPRSAVDPADGATTYFLHDHAGSVEYTLSTYVDTAFSGLEYIASYSDLEAAFGQDASI